MTSTLWTVEKIGQLSTNVTYNDPTVTYNDPTVQYGGTYQVIWILQVGGQ